MKRYNSFHRAMGAYTFTVDEGKELLPFLESDEARIFFSYTAVKEHAVNDIIVGEGERSDWMGFVIEGKLKVKKEAIFPGKFVLVAILERGAMVGELSAIDQSQRTAIVEVLEPCKILYLSSDRIESLLDEHPHIGIKFLKWIIHIAAIRVHKADDRLAKLL